MLWRVQQIPCKQMAEGSRLSGTASLSSEVRNSPLTPRWCHRCEATSNHTGDALTWTAQPSTRPGDVWSAPTPSCANTTVEQDWSSWLVKLGADRQTRPPISSRNSPRRRREVCLVFFKSGQDRLGRCGGAPCWRAAVLELSRCRSFYRRAVVGVEGDTPSSSAGERYPPCASERVCSRRVHVYSACAGLRDC